MAATVNEIADGRLVLGVGAGWNKPEFTAFGIPDDHLASRFEESFDVVRRLVDGERVSLAGRFVRADDAVLYPRRARRPALMVDPPDHASCGPRCRGSRVERLGPVVRERPRGVRACPGGGDDLPRGRAPSGGRSSRSIWVYVEVDVAPDERAFEEDAPPLSGGVTGIASGLRAFADAGADEAILVLNVVTERSIAELGPVLELLDA